MATSDILTRIGAVLMIFSALWNGVVSLFFILTMIWVLVGLFWFIPLFLAFVNVCLAVAYLVLGHNKASAVGPLLGMMISLCNLNVFGFMLDMIVLAVMIGGYVARASEDKADLAHA